MEIYTKFNIGDTIYYMKDNAVQSSVVHSLRIQVSKGERSPYKITENVIYSYIPNVRGGPSCGTPTEIHESNIFSTKAELLASL